jgi:hypothetical protein
LVAKLFEIPVTANKNIAAANKTKLLNGDISHPADPFWPSDLLVFKAKATQDRHRCESEWPFLF